MTEADMPQTTPGGADPEALGAAGAVRHPPYHDQRESLLAAQRLTDPLTKSRERLVIFDRLRQSGPVALVAVRELLRVFSRQDLNIRQAILELVVELQSQGVDLGEEAGEISRHLTDANFKVRAQAKQVLLALGPSAQPATPRILACLRHPLAEIQETGVDLVRSLGPDCLKLAEPKLQLLLRQLGDNQPLLKQKTEETLRFLQGRPDIEALDRIVLGQNAPVGPVDQPPERLMRAVEPEPEPAPLKPLAPLAPLTPLLATGTVSGLAFRRILLLEEGKAARRLLSGAFRVEQCQVQTAADGEEALAKLIAEAEAGRPIELLLASVTVNGISTAQLLSRVRNNSRLGRLAVMLLGSADLTEETLRAARYGLDAYADHGISRAQLLEIALSALARRSS